VLYFSILVGPDLEDFQVPCHPKKEEMGERVIPFGQNLYIERSDFFDTHGPEGEANGGRVPKGFKRLLHNDKVRLKYAYVIHCDEVVRDPVTNEPVELKCTMFPETRAGVTPEGMKRVNGIIQWVEATTAIKCTINQYDRLFLTEEPGKVTGNFLDDVNPNSLQVLDDCLVEPSVLDDCLELMTRINSVKKGDWNKKIYHSELAYQFERTGYFALDPDSTSSKPVFNRVVTLRDTWAVPQAETIVDGSTNNNRNRGRGDNLQTDSSNAVLEDIRRVAIRAGTILEAEQHPDAENLVVCRLDCGDDGSDPRTVVASLGGKIKLDDLVNKKVACVTNLKPAKMRGIESTAMLLAASNGVEGSESIIELLEIPDSVPNGELLYFDGKERPEPDVMMKSKGALKAFDRVKSCLRVNSSGHAIFSNDGIEHQMLSSAGPVKVSSLTNVVIQ
jgi:methionine--tRNA ligase beta chain